MRVVVIGAGIVGASAAYHLSKENNEVILIDANHQGRATAAGAGIICPWPSLERDEKWYEIANEAAHFYPKLIEDLQEAGEEKVSYKKVGSLVTATDEALLEDYLEVLHNRRDKAPLMGNIEKLSAKEAQELFPPLHDEMKAIYIPGGARVDGRRLTKALINLSETQGVQLIEGQASLAIEGEKVVGAHVDNQTYTADKVLITAGAWVKDLLASLNLSLRVEPQRGQIVHLDLPNTETDDWPVISPAGSGHYIVSFGPSRVVLGATRETESGFDHRLTAGGVAEVLNEGLKVAPGLNNSTLAEIRIGFRPMSENNLPLIGPVEQIDHLFLANGLGPSGLTIGPFVGQLISKMIQQQEMNFDLSPYTPKLQTI